jgi:hypothetical protein
VRVFSLGDETMANTIGAETIIDNDFERERAELLKRAEEKPTLRMINAKEARPVEEWKRLYEEQALFIEVTKEDFSKVYEGKLIATAESSVEFLDLDNEYEQRGIVNLTTYGNPIDPRPIPLPPIFWFGTGLPE